MKNKVVFITGGARGLGAGLAAKVLSKGGKAFIVDLNAEAVFEQVETLGGEAIAGCQANVCKPADLELAMAECKERFGRIDVVVVNAGILKMGSIEHMNPADFDAVMQVNVNGAFNTIRAGIPYLRETKGYLQVISSLAAAIHTPLMGHYAASKAAVEALADVARQELALDGIDVGCVHPTFTNTAMIQEVNAGVLWGGHKGAFGAIEPKQVIDAMYRGIEKRQRKIIAPKTIAPLVLAPGLFHRVAEGLSRLQGSEQALKKFKAEESESLTRR
ncbi:SDR family NAD(P)-dependent oxidoreductase [Limnobacter alexandrii]|jgi:NAD(P)-dependent dehydrogenase (short-subunit alcohol dehydrogenase family)|uniref:SDR family NAD(P)-dependent oxidoreductase n=1 Tax=Limnobacter alexandrii TaxID=2570352 RepID=UPI00110828F9|nr:SDR family NAD(P)-dependent oxidoreductase [Limnobacter alexandrii]